MQFLIRPPPDRAERKSGQISESVCILTQRMQGKEICVEMRFIMKSKVKKRCKQMLRDCWHYLCCVACCRRIQ